MSADDALVRKKEQFVLVLGITRVVVRAVLHFVPGEADKGPRK